MKVFILFRSRLQKFLVYCLVLICKINSKNKFSLLLFNLSIKFSGGHVFRETQNIKKIILDFIRNNQIRYNKLNEIILKDNDQNYLDKLKSEGIVNITDLMISQSDVEYVNSYFNNTKYFYDSHTPLVKNRKTLGEKPTGAYASYDFNTQLNCTPILKACLNQQILSIAQNYLGTVPLLFSLNTFKTFPDQEAEAFTHSFHRDLDNLLWVVFFVYWTKTSENDGGFQQIKFTHSISKNFKYDNTKYESPQDFIFNTIPGYNKDEEYLDFFDKNDIASSYGDPGTVTACDTFGLHRGMPVKTPRLVTWLRYGPISSRQKLEKASYYKSKAKLTHENRKLVKSSLHKQILNDLVEF